MAPSRTAHRRLLVPLLLAAILAGEVTGLAIAAGSRPSNEVPAATAGGPSNTAGRARAGSWDAAAERTGAGARGAGTVGPAPDVTIGGFGGAGTRQVQVRHSLGRGPTARPAIDQEVKVATDLAATYAGRNHVWIPSLGIDRSVAAFPCTRTRPPDNHLYRWGCAGSNNVYLLGHAHSVFKPLHDAYVSGRLRKGMEVIYADGGGTVRTYAVIWWRKTRPTAAASWAWAPQPTPSMTLQTCLGANNEFRLMVRLAATD